MKNTKTNMGSFATAKLHVKRQSLLTLKLRSILAIIVIVTVIGFLMACGGSNVLPLENNLWDVWRENTSTASLVSHSVDNDGVCTVTIGGTPESDPWISWKITAEYLPYSGNAGKKYEYTFEAWTQSGARDLYIQYYNNNDDAVYLVDIVPITSVRTTYTFRGNVLPKKNFRGLLFQLANQLGTVNIKMIDINEY